MFGQLLNILVVYKDFAIPVCHVLMSGKDEGLYDKILLNFKELVGDFQPESAMSDFERAILNSLKTAFPNSRVTGCRFHFGQAGNLFHFYQSV